MIRTIERRIVAMDANLSERSAEDLERIRGKVDAKLRTAPALSRSSDFMRFVAGRIDDHLFWKRSLEPVSKLVSLIEDARLEQDKGRLKFF